MRESSEQIKTIRTEQLGTKKPRLETSSGDQEASEK